jgi:hypothetical protein
MKLNAAAVGASADGETNAALADPRIKARLAEFGGTILAGSPADFESRVSTRAGPAARSQQSIDSRPAFP